MTDFPQFPSGVTHVIAALGAGGAETLVRDLATAQVAAGLPARIVALSSPRRFGRDPGFSERTHVAARRAGIEVIELGFGGKRDLLRHAGALRRAVDREDGGMIHVHVASALVGLVWLRPIAPVVYTLHSTYLPFARPWFRLFDRVIAQNIGVCTAGTRLLAQTSRRPARTIANGRRPRAMAKAPTRTGNGEVTVLAVGNLLAEKDYPTLLAAAAIVRDRMREYGRPVPRFAIAGEGPLHAALAAEIAARGLSATVELLGTRADIDALMDDADMLLSSSATEALPISMIEALQAGLPIVATDVGGVSDIVTDGHNGRLVPPGDPQALAEAISTVAGDSGMRARMAAASAARARHFSIEACRIGHDGVYAAALVDRQH